MLRALTWPVLAFAGLALGWQAPVFLAWAAWVAPCAGWHLGARSLGNRRDFALFQVALAALCLIAILGPVAGTGALFAWCALSGLSALAFGLAERFSSPESANRGAALAAILGLVLAILPTGGGLLDHGWAQRSPEVVALAMDATPAVFVLECAGLDVFRMPYFYNSDTTDFVMGIRRPWNTPLAPIVLLVVGYALVFLPKRQLPAST